MKKQLRPPKVPKARFHVRHSDPESLIKMTYNYHYRGKHIQFSYSTSMKINPKHWDVKARRAKHIRGREDYLDLNRRLDAFAEIAQAVFLEFDYGRKLPPEKFREELNYRTGKEKRPEDQQAPTLFSFIRDFIEKQKSKATAKRGTWKKFVTVFNHLQDFAADQGREELNFEDIDWKFKYEFEDWLYSPPRNHATNNAAKIFEVVKQFMREAQRMGLHQNATYQENRFGIKRVKVKNKVRLTFKELEQLLGLDLSQDERLEKVRDLFIVGAYTGLRFSDWHSIKPEQLSTEDGVELLEIVTRKQRNLVVIPVFPALKKILVKYDYQLPKISIQKFNAYIKEVCQTALGDKTFLRIYSEAGTVKDEVTEKWRKVSSHAARRSFASNFWEAGTPAALLMQITGHATERQFFEYIDIDPSQAARQFAKIARQVLIEQQRQNE